jgi:hypothetical protein
MASEKDYYKEDFLNARLKFLEMRAEYHLQYRKDGFERSAIAATTYRDAAALAFLLHNTNRARECLLKAGTLFLDIGLVYGASLVALASPKEANSLVSDYSDVLNGARNQRYKGELDGNQHQRPFSTYSRSLPRQLLSLLQFDYLSNRRDTLNNDGYIHVLKRLGGHPVGVTGVSVSTYMLLCEILTSQDMNYRVQAENITIRGLTQGLDTILSSRLEAIGAGIKDTYHWRKLLRPAELIDFDSVVLFYLAILNKVSSGLFERFLADDVTYLGSSVKAAKLLYDSQ